MGKEIEKKYLVTDDSYKRLAQPKLYRQGYLSSSPDRVVRVRIVDDKAFITIKGPASGATRDEYEYEIPREDAQEMLNNLCEKPIIEKHRYIIDYSGRKWEVDEFHGENEGLVITEIELEDINQEYEMPLWVGEEVTADQRYANSNLIKNPFSKWHKNR